MASSVVLAGALTLSGCTAAETPAGPPKTGNDAYDNVLQRVYDKNPDEPWWGDIDKARYRLGNLTISTSYRLEEAEDIIAAALLCKAIVEEIQPSGVSAGVWIHGTLLRGRRQADGSIATREDSTWNAASGGTGKRGNPPYCVANATLPNVVEPLEAQGWVYRRTIEGIRDIEERRAKLATMNLYNTGFHTQAEQLEDGTWVYFGR
jgi:hypothetical protein